MSFGDSSSYADTLYGESPSVDKQARYVRVARAHAHLTREVLAQKTGLTFNQIKAIEDGRRNVTTNEELLAIAHACGVPEAFMWRGFNLHDDRDRELAAEKAAQWRAVWKVASAMAERGGIDLDALADEHRRAVE